MKKKEKFRAVRHFMIDGGELPESEVTEEMKQEIYQALERRAMEAAGCIGIRKKQKLYDSQESNRETREHLSEAIHKDGNDETKIKNESLTYKKRKTMIKKMK